MTQTREQKNIQAEDYREKNRKELNEKQKIYNEKKKEETKAYKKEYYEKNKEEIREKGKERYQKNKDKIKPCQREKNVERRLNIKNCANEMLEMKTINDTNLWHSFCNSKRQSAKKYPYSEDFTDDVFFEKMKDGCVYCGDTATTIDRVDSTLGHTPSNCVGCCCPCNLSKGNGDPDTFIRKAYYRARGKYVDDIEDIWSDNVKRKTRFDMAKSKSQKQQRDFTLSRDEWDDLIIGDCVYCKRALPRGKWFGVDRIIPTVGYTLENTVSCCSDCNNDKGDLTVTDMERRNNQIATRLDNDVIVLFGCEKVLRNYCK